LQGHLDHPNIVKIYDVGQQDNNAYIVMEYVEGVDVQRLLTDGRVTPEAVRTVLSSVTKALDYAHGRGGIHRDIRPSNILVSHNGVVTITDFGIARVEGLPAAWSRLHAGFEPGCVQKQFRYDVQMNPMPHAPKKPKDKKRERRAYDVYLQSHKPY